MDKVQKPSNSECYTPLSEPFRICQQINFMNGITVYFEIHMKPISTMRGQCRDFPILKQVVLSVIAVL
jgi:hypothetical protein